MTGGRIDGVRSSDGQTVRTDAVVNCAGPDAGEVAALAGVDLPMRNTAGLLAYTAASPVAVGRVIHAPQIHLRPDGGGRLVLGNITADAAVSTHDGDTRIAEPGAAIRVMLHRAAELYPGASWQQSQGEPDRRAADPDRRASRARAKHHHRELPYRGHPQRRDSLPARRGADRCRGPR